MKGLFISAIAFCFLPACSSSFKTTHNPSDSFRQYWFRGEAEISSYELRQIRYGHPRKGNSVLIFVTEPFSPSGYTKTEQPSYRDKTVLKLNFTKKFNTGIYPYSMMTSTFLPVNNPKHSLKISSSSQEWCGHTYMEMLNKNRFEIEIKSYFENEPRHLEVKKTWMEDDFWSILRIDPDLLPEGQQQVFPGFFFLRLKHKDSKAYQCQISRSKRPEETTYTLYYPDLERTLAITYTNTFPFTILEWKETYPESGELMTTSATLKKTLKIPYWEKNTPSDYILRDSLRLDPL